MKSRTGAQRHAARAIDFEGEDAAVLKAQMMMRANTRALGIMLIVSLLTAVITFWVGVSPAAAREVVAATPDLQPGVVVIRTKERALYLSLGDGRALRYRVAVGKPGKQWFGPATIDGKYVQPAWSPPPEVKRDKPSLPDVIAGGAPNNPMGAAALTLNRGQYAIHGTSRSMRASIGTFASYGCIRMLDEDIVDLYQRVRVGTSVIVVQ
jgi:lipoprotein-anchoring transpeptidase ErfK/SrfK